MSTPDLQSIANSVRSLPVLDRNISLSLMTEPSDVQLEKRNQRKLPPMSYWSCGHGACARAVRPRVRGGERRSRSALGAAHRLDVDAAVQRADEARLGGETRKEQLEVAEPNHHAWALRRAQRAVEHGVQRVVGVRPRLGVAAAPGAGHCQSGKNTGAPWAGCLAKRGRTRAPRRARARCAAPRGACACTPPRTPGRPARALGTHADGFAPCMPVWRGVRASPHYNRRRHARRLTCSTHGHRGRGILSLLMPRAYYQL